jgi:hypothetical protein
MLTIEMPEPPARSTARADGGGTPKRFGSRRGATTAIWSPLDRRRGRSRHHHALDRRRRVVVGSLRTKRTRRNLLLHLTPQPATAGGRAFTEVVVGLMLSAQDTAHGVPIAWFMEPARLVDPVEISRTSASGRRSRSTASASTRRSRPHVVSALNPGTALQQTGRGRLGRAERFPHDGLQWPRAANVDRVRARWQPLHLEPRQHARRGVLRVIVGEQRCRDHEGDDEEGDEDD